MKSYFIVLLAVASGVLQAQNPRILNGKITSDVSELGGIFIANLSANKSTLSLEGGYFRIAASRGDTLMFSSVQFHGKRIVLKESDFETELFFVRLESMITQLDEVIVKKYNGIDAVSLGIIPKGQKVYTPAERKLRTATSLKGTGGIGLDPLLNWMTGRTAMLKKELVVERNEFMLTKIENLFEEEYFTGQLKIPIDYVRGFCYYIIEDKAFVQAINSKNRIMAEFLLAGLAVKYNEFIAVAPK